jgi:SAM-dependent methyltransferase
LKPSETARHYDAIAAWWDAQQDSMTAGLRYLQRAIDLCSQRRKALDVGCGSGGRIVSALTNAGFDVVGVDVSDRMLAYARARHPTATFIHADICDWESPERYDLIVAWDSTFHLPHTSQQPVLEDLCRHLVPGGVLLFTAGAVNGEITGEMAGETFYYSSLGMARYARILDQCGCTRVLIERDHPSENHVVAIASRPLPEHLRGATE